MTWAREFRQEPERHMAMNMNSWIRQVHRWLAILFTLAVIANLIALARGGPPDWITYSPLVPLFLLMFTGLYMFALPYVAAGRTKREKLEGGSEK